MNKHKPRKVKAENLSANIEEKNKSIRNNRFLFIDFDLELLKTMPKSDPKIFRPHLHTS